MSNFKKYLIQAINEQVGEQQMGGDCYYQLAVCVPGSNVRPAQVCWQYWCDGEQISSGPPNGQPPKCCMAGTCVCKLPGGGPFPPEKAEGPQGPQESQPAADWFASKRDGPSMFGS